MTENYSIENPGRRIFLGGLVGLVASGLSGCALLPEERERRERMDRHLAYPPPNFDLRGHSDEESGDIKRGKWNEIKVGDSTILSYYFKYADVEKVAEPLQKVFPEQTVEPLVGTNGIISRISDYEIVPAFKKQVEALDFLPQQYGVRIKAVKRFADKTKDREIRAKINSLAPGSDAFSFVSDILLPGASLRDLQRKGISGSYGIVYRNERTQFELGLDTLISEGYVTEDLGFIGIVESGRKVEVYSNEKVPFKETIIVGNNLEETTRLELVKSGITTSLQSLDDELVRVKFDIEVGVLLPSGSSQVPKVGDEGSKNEGLVMRSGEGIFVGGSFRKVERDVGRGIPLLRWLTGDLAHDYETLNQRTLYYITLEKIPSRRIGDDIIEPGFEHE